MVILTITRAPVVILAIVPVVILVSWAVAWMIHVASRPAATSVTIINHATVHRTDRQNGKEYRRNELLHIESFINEG
jgi:hypothetical protein